MWSIQFPDWDRDLFIYLNSKNHPWLDPLMVFLSNHMTWFVVLGMVVFYIMYRKRDTGLSASIFLLLGIGINGLLNHMVKIIIMRPRPGNEELLKELINQLEIVGDSYSFFSAHSSSSMCLAMFSTLYLRNKFYGWVIFIWATAVAYSRIYVGKHYPLDVLAGTVFGLLIGWITYQFYLQYRQRYDQSNRLKR